MARRARGDWIGGTRRQGGFTLVVFSSVLFLFYFLPLFICLYCAAPGIASKNIVLLLASLIFYAWGEPWFVLVLLPS